MSINKADSEVLVNDVTLDTARCLHKGTQLRVLKSLHDACVSVSSNDGSVISVKSEIHTSVRAGNIVNTQVEQLRNKEGPVWNSCVDGLLSGKKVSHFDFKRSIG